ncbi:uncharacterized protein [Battus philenor]|uniref:uncharacterized protein n=1 Tax=Battus philenor TaxID=42288 RepID=UPI0035D0980A
MISVTPYTFQPATSRIVRLWKNARAVSDWVTLTVCPCCEARMSSATSTYTNTSEPSFSKQSQLLVTPAVDAGRATGEPFQPHHVVIDFSPRPEDTNEVQERCLEFLKLINKTGNFKEVCTSKTDEVIPEEASVCSSRNKEKSDTYDSKEDFPAIHAFKKLQAKDAVRTAFETSIIKTPNNC